MFRRKIFPKRSWSVLATCESGRLCSSSTLSLFLRPMTASWLGTGSVGFSVPSMNPVRSRSWRYGQLEVSSASEATSESSAIAARDVEDHVVGAARQSENCVVLRGRHDEAVAAGNVLVEAGQVRRRVVRKRLAPGLGPDAGDEIDAAHRRPRLAQRGDRSHQACRRLSLRSIELEVRVCSCPEREDAALRATSRGHATPYAKRRTNASVVRSGPRAKPGRIRPAVGLAARDEQPEVRLVQLLEEPEAEEEVG